MIDAPNDGDNAGVKSGRLRSYSYAEDYVLDEIEADELELPLAEMVEEVDPHLVELSKMHDMIGDFVMQVINGLAPGVIISGPGGSGKSYTTLKKLRQHKTSYRQWNSQMTAKGLYTALKDHPDHIHVLEDMEQLFNKPEAAGVLRSALYSQETKSEKGVWPRKITWSTSKTRDEFEFTGGLIILMNRPLPNTPEMEAVKTRVGYIEMSVTDAHILAKMRAIAADGCDDGQITLSAEACNEVVDVIEQLWRDLGTPLDLRLLEHGRCDRYCSDTGQLTTSWQTMIETRMRQRVIVIDQTPKSKQQEIEEELKLLAEILAVKPSDASTRKQWCDATGWDDKTYYRRKRELEQKQQEKADAA